MLDRTLAAPWVTHMPVGVSALIRGDEAAASKSVLFTSPAALRSLRAHRHLGAAKPSQHEDYEAKYTPDTQRGTE